MFLVVVDGWVGFFFDEFFVVLCCLEFVWWLLVNFLGLYGKVVVGFVVR